MRRPSIRADFSRARFVAAVRFIAATRGVREVRYLSVAELCRTSASAIQRYFPTAESLRAALVDEWLEQLRRGQESPPSAGVAGVWELLGRWFLTHAAFPVPLELLRPAPPGPESPEWDGLRQRVLAAIADWRGRLGGAISAASGWRAEANLTHLVESVFVASLGFGATEPLVGEVAALRSGAQACSALLEAAAAAPPAFDVEALVRSAERSIHHRPSAAWIAEEATTAESVKPRRKRGRPRAPEPSGPTNWDEFLAQEIADLAEYRRRHPKEFEAS